jgi:Uma2 family endonuclease
MTQAAPRHRYTEDEYVALEHQAETKSELINGEIFAMSGARPRHNALAANLIFGLKTQLRASGSRCVVLSSDQRIRSEATGMNTYADAVVACAPRFDAKHREALENPAVIVEVLSKSTEAYDRGAKFAHYRTLPGLSDYVLVWQRAHRVEHFKRLDTGQWLLTVLDGDEAQLELPSLGCAIPLGEIYAQTDDLPGDDEASEREPAPS